MFKAVIVDDEHDAIEGIKLIIRENCNKVEIVGTASSVSEAIQVITEKKPQIVFLDIEMPSGSGFDVLEGISERNFNVIFVTAYNQYAIKAFKYSAIDYLLKPVDIDDLIHAIDKAGKALNNANPFETKINTLLENMNRDKPEKIALSTAESIEFVKICDIVQIQAEGSYSSLHFIDQSKLVVSKNLGEFESLLEDHPFYRSHQSHLINLKQVKKITRLGNEVVMEDGSIAYLSRRKKNHFLELMASMVQQKNKKNPNLR